MRGWTTIQINSFASNLVFDFNELKIKNTGVMSFSCSTFLYQRIPNNTASSSYTTDMVLPSSGELRVGAIVFLEKLPTDIGYFIRLYSFEALPELEVSYPRWFLGTLSFNGDLTKESFTYKNSTFLDSLCFRKTFIFRSGQKITNVPMTQITL